MSIPAAIPAEQITRPLSTKRRAAGIVVFGATCRPAGCRGSPGRPCRASPAPAPR
jgi:hypothetical protein